MKKKLLFGFTLVSGLLSAQVGIGTDNPKATLDINGDLKIDKVNTIEKLNEEDNNYLLIKGNDNIVKKIKPINYNSETRKPILAVLDPSGYSGNNIGINATNSYIELPKGKWIVQASILIKCTGFKQNQSQWIRTTFSDTANGDSSSDIQSGPYISGAITGPTEHSTLNGSIIIENKNETSKKYYFVKYSTDYYNSLGINNGSDDRCKFENFGSRNWSENNIFATPL